MLLALVFPRDPCSVLAEGARGLFSWLCSHGQRVQQSASGPRWSLWSVCLHQAVPETPRVEIVG